MSTLEWILDGLDPEITGWGGDAAERMSADFARRWPPQQFVRIIRAKAEEFGTSAVESLESVRAFVDGERPSAVDHG